MAETTLFELVSPERLLVSEPVGMVVMPGSEGDFAAMPRHAPMIATLRPGVIDVYDGGKIAERIFVAGGFAEVTETRCTVLAEEATRLSEVDVAAAEKAIADDRDVLKDTTDPVERGKLEERVRSREAMIEAKRRVAA